MTPHARIARALAFTVLAVVLAVGTARAGEPCAGLPGDAFAFIPFGGGSCASPGVHWTNASVVFDCDFLADSDKLINCGGDTATCIQLCRTATDVWNGDLADRFTFIEHGDATPVAFCDGDDGRTSVGGTTHLCDGTSYGARVLAVTLSRFFDSGPQAGQLVDADITVNQSFKFTQKGFQATLAHEFGHVLGLAHPNQCDRDFNVLMRSASLFASDEPCFVLDPTSDDLNGARSIYPFRNPAPVVCGDADQNGTVTVSDGVQTLRAAAGLSSSCTVARCDVDGGGTITLADGVAVLRTAAGLTSIAQCPEQ
jgi:hypothetical protein